jgi:outer membrane biosynthesis protein TonB
MTAQAPRLALPFGAAAALHAGVVAAIIFLSTRPPIMLPPIYRVNIIGAPAAPKPAAGVVPANPTPPAAQPKTPPPPAHATPPKADVAPVPKARPRPAPPKATPTPPTTKAAPSNTPAPTAASKTGGPGTDVANVHTEGVDFPYPWYLENIVRQVALNFSPDNPSSNLRAEVTFLIKRDGTVIGFRFIQRSSNYAFDLEAQGAIEKAETSFGPLPQGFPDDVLPVVFSFDPRLIH